MFEIFLGKKVKKETKEEARDRFDGQYPPAVHNEPDCRGFNKCRYMELHKHGFECDKSCEECWGLCHPECPANTEKEMI